jgi:hypothetical protein
MRILRRIRRIMDEPDERTNVTQNMRELQILKAEEQSNEFLIFSSLLEK